MPIPAQGENLKLGKGSLLLRAYGSAGGFQFVGNASAITLTADQTVAEKYSSTQQAAPLIARAPVRTGYTLGVTLDEYKLETLKYFLLASQTSAPQAGGSGLSDTIDNIVLGEYYMVERSAGVQAWQLENVVITRGSDVLVLNEDYQLFSQQGMIRPLAGGPADLQTNDDLVVTFQCPDLTIHELRGSQVAAPEVEILYNSDDANSAGVPSKDQLRVWRASIGPEGELPFISEEFGSYQLTMGVLSDATNHPGNEFFALYRAA